MDETQEAQLLGGIDEAGLGPLLGPLVVAGVLLEGPAGLRPWEELDSVFCKKPVSRSDTRIRVDDSKRVKSGPHGKERLERSALAFFYARHGKFPETLGELLQLDAHGNSAWWTRYPWYAEAESVPLPRWNDAGRLELDAHNAQRQMEAAEVRVQALSFHTVHVLSFNALIEKHDNKSLAHFEASLPILEVCLSAPGSAVDEQRQLVVDRHGGREHYGGLLRRSLPGRRVEVLRETKEASLYRIDGRLRLVFSEKAEDKAFPAAAASCIAKYVRELCIDRLNAHYSALCKDLKGTAGYYKDGRRFLDELAERGLPAPLGLLRRIR